MAPSARSSHNDALQDGQAPAGLVPLPEPEAAGRQQPLDRFPRAVGGPMHGQVAPRLGGVPGQQSLQRVGGRAGVDEQEVGLLQLGRQRVLLAEDKLRVAGQRLQPVDLGVPRQVEADQPAWLGPQEGQGRGALPGAQVGDVGALAGQLVQRRQVRLQRGSARAERLLGFCRTGRVRRGMSSMGQVR
jgi:hypothetical protein